MAKSKKEKKAARRERQQQLSKAVVRVQEKLFTELLDGADEEEEEVQYVLSEEEEEEAPDSPEAAAATAPSVEPTTQSKPAQKVNNTSATSAPAAAASNEEEDEDRVKLPGVTPATSKPPTSAAAPHTGRKHHRIPWEQLKIAVVDKFGPEAAKIVSEHDGNAEDPFFTVQMKLQYGSVPVPRHWNKLRTFLSLQADREEAINVIPPSIYALGIHKVRASKQRHQAPDQRAVVACFMTGTPLQHHDFNVPLSRHGEVFYEGKWRPKTKYVPGQLSQRLQQALGINSASPPPWLYSMQTMRRLPPAYPAIRLPGLNAPIPPGALWGRGQGQWGEPPRGEGNTFLFPSVMGERAEATVNADSGWGRVPPLEDENAVASTAPSSAPPPPLSTAPPPVASQPTPAPRGGAATHPAVTPTPFQPKAFMPHQAFNQGGNQYGPSAPREYVRVQDSGVGSVVAVGHTYVQRGAAHNSSAARRRPPPPSAPQTQRGGKQQHQQRGPRTAPAQPQNKPNPPQNSGTTRF